MVDLKAQHMESVGYAIDYGLGGWGLNPIQGHMAGMSACIRETSCECIGK